MKALTAILNLGLLIFGFKAFALNEIKVQGDLMIHPAQVAKLFEMSTSSIVEGANWQWAQLNFTQPYQTQWSQVAAQGPFQLKIDSQNLNQGLVGFELDWANPQVNIERFEIHDVITRQVGGANLTIHLDGTCHGMSVRIPNGAWKIKGLVKWTLGAQSSVTWADFQFAVNPAAVVQVDLGQCDAPAGLQQELKSAIESAVRDNTLVQGLLKDGVFTAIADGLKTFESELLKARPVELKKDMTLTWQPREITDEGQGLVRVAGELVLQKASSSQSSTTLARSFDVKDLAAVNESGFVLPKDTLPAVIAFMQKNGELGMRLQTNDIAAFKDLMQSRFKQFFVWPDLMKFSKSTNFYVDLSSKKAPELTGGAVLKGGGIQYRVSAPLVANQWAPGIGKSSKQYVPYMEFASPLNGLITAKINGGGLEFRLVPQDLKVSNQTRPEYGLLRRVNDWIATSLLGSDLVGYLKEQTFKIASPTFEMREGVGLRMRDLQVWKQSFRIPLELIPTAKNSK